MLSPNSNGSPIAASCFDILKYSNKIAHWPVPLRVTIGIGNRRKFVFSWLIALGTPRVLLFGKLSRTARGFIGVKVLESSFIQAMPSFIARKSAGTFG